MAKVENHGDALHLKEYIQPFDTMSRASFHCYSTPEALAAHCLTVKEADAWQTSAWANRSESEMGTRDLATAVKLCREGWPGGAQRASEMRDRINAANPTGPRIVRYDVAGAYPSVARAIAGNPLNMRRIDTAKLRRRPVMTLVSDMAVNWNTDGATITRRAAVVAAVVDAIESAGYACQVLATSACASGNTVAASCAVEIKESGSPVDIGRMAFALGHAAMFRRLCWVTYGESRFTEKLGQSLGTAASLFPSAEMAAKSVYVLPSTLGAAKAFDTDQAAETAGLKYIVDSLAAQGCPAFQTQEADAA